MKTTWNLDLLLKKEELENIPKLRKEVEKRNYAFINKWKDRKDYLENEDVLLEALNEYEKLNADGGQMGEEAIYYYLASHLNQSDTEIKAKYNENYQFTIKLTNEIQFFAINLSKIPLANQKKFLASKKLSPYNYYLKRLFDLSKYILTDSEEKIMNIKQKTSNDNWKKMMQDLLSKQERYVITKTGKKVKKHFAEISELSTDKNKNVRDYAYKVLTEILEKYEEVAEYEINTVYENTKNDMQVRGYKNPINVRIDNEDIDEAVFNSLRDAVTKRFYISKNFYKLKAKLFGKKKLDFNERAVEYGKVDKKYSFDKAYELISNMFKSLDPEFQKIVEKYFENGQVDVFPKKGKYSGGFCATFDKTSPSFILINFLKKVDDLRTIAHEFGHAINAELSRKQNSLLFENPIVTAEVASTFFEDFMFNELLKTADDETKLSLLVSKVFSEIATIINQIGSVNFESELHEYIKDHGYASAKEINKMFLKHIKSFNGQYVDYSKTKGQGWIAWPHLRNNFYNYTYAFGLLISKALQKRVKEDPGYIEKVKVFLSAGGSDSPKNIFKNIGIDISKPEIWNDGLDEIEGLLKETEKLAKKLGKI